MQVITHNLLSQYTDRQLNIAKKDKSKSMERLSSGYKINRSADNAAGLEISENMRQQVRGLKRGGKNTQEGISWLQVADGAMDEITSIIQRIRELAVQASNDTNTQEDRAALDSEIKELRNELNRICLDKAAGCGYGRRNGGFFHACADRAGSAVHACAGKPDAAGDSQFDQLTRKPHSLALSRQQVLEQGVNSNRGTHFGIDKLNECCFF